MRWHVISTGVKVKDIFIIVSCILLAIATVIVTLAQVVYLVWLEIILYNVYCCWIKPIFSVTVLLTLEALKHYNDVIMSAMASQITGVSTVYSTICSGADQRKYRSSTSLAFVMGIHRWSVNSPHKGPVTRKMFPFGDVIMSYRFDSFDDRQERYNTSQGAISM